MEFDILNEIITGSVAQLFTDLHKHSNFMKTSSQMGQDKSEIPKSSYGEGGLSNRDREGGSGMMMTADSPVA